MSELIYEDLEEDGTPSNAKTIEKQAREGKTPLQIKALNSTRRKYFASAKQHKQFKAFEARALGADPESRVFKAWMEDRMAIAVRILTMTMEQLIASFGNEVKFDAWQARNRQKVLSKPAIEEVRSTMEERMKQRMEKHK